MKKQAYFLRGRAYREEKKEAREAKKEAVATATTPAERRAARAEYRSALDELKQDYPMDIGNALASIAPLRTGMEIALKQKGITPSTQFVPMVMQFARFVLGVTNLPNLGKTASFDPVTVSAIISLVKKIVAWFKMRADNRESLPVEERDAVDRTQETVDEVLRETGEDLRDTGNVLVRMTGGMGQTEMLVLALIAGFVLFSK